MVVTKPIIFTYLQLPASRRVILNGLSDPWAGSEPLENMVSQMKLSQLVFGSRLFSRFSPVTYYSVIPGNVEKADFLKGEEKDP